MAIAVNRSSEGEVILSLEEKFDFNCVESFRSAYESLDQAGGKKLVIDLRRTSYMDSSALGMLINMQKYWGAADGAIHIINTTPQIKKIFTISRFDKKFSID